MIIPTFPKRLLSYFFSNMSMHIPMTTSSLVWQKLVAHESIAKAEIYPQSIDFFKKAWYNDYV